MILNKIGLLAYFAYTLTTIANEPVGSVLPSPRYIVSYGPWDGESWEAARNVVFQLNGRSIGYPREAFTALDELPVDPGDLIRFDTRIPLRRIVDRPIFAISSFLYRWVERGASIEFYEDGERIPLHIVSWTDWGDANSIESMDALKWVVDGNQIGGGEKLRSLITAWRKEGALIILLKPIGWMPTRLTGPETRGTAFDFLRSSAAEGRIRLFTIQPGPAEAEMIHDGSVRVLMK